MNDLFNKAETHEVLHWSSLTPMVNEIKSPNSFVLNLLFGTREVKMTEKIELSVIVGGREVAPFVRKHNEAVFVSGYGEAFQTIEPPNIRMKRVIQPFKVMNERRPGTVIFPKAGEQLSAMERYMGQQGQRLADLATNAEEWLACMVIRGQITYQVTDQENYVITVPRPAANVTAAPIPWDDPDPSLPRIQKDFLTAKKIISDAVGLQPTDCIMGETAGFAFLDVLSQQDILNMLHFQAGDVTANSNFRQDGAIYLGLFCNVRCWMYPRTVSLNGTSVPLIRADYAEFVCADAAAENVVYYAPIDDDDALEGGNFAVQRFSKSWKTPDPSQRFMLLASRPLPWARRPGSMVSMQVTG